MLDSLWKLSYDSAWIDILRNSLYAIPLVQGVHLIGITLILSSVLAWNLRVLGVGMRSVPADALATEVWRWWKLGFILTVTSGIVVFVPDPARYAANTAFLTKMTMLILATVIQLTWFRRAVNQPDAPNSKAMAILSLTLWFAVGWGGRAIAFLG